MAGFDVITEVEDGVPQTIVGFSRSPLPPERTSEKETTAQTTNRIAHSAQTVSPGHTYLICIDALHSGFDNFARVRKALKSFFEKQEPDDSQYALFALGRQLHPIIDSTRDPSAILAALDTKNLLRTIRDSEAVNLKNEVEQFEALVGQWCGSCQCASIEMDVAALGCPGYKAQVRSSAMSFSQRTAMLNDTFFAELTSLVNALATMPTKRTVLFISDGFNRYAGQELTVILQANNVGDSSLKFNPLDLQPRADKVLQIATKNNVRFYSLDSRGLYTYSMVPGTGEDASSSHGASTAIRQAQVMVAWQNSDFMAEIARQTGGRFFNNSNDLLKGIQRAFSDGREEYVLAYVSTNATYDGKFRRIEVKAKPKAAHVAAKEGYWANP